MVLEIKTFSVGFIISFNKNQNEVNIARTYEPVVRRLAQILTFMEVDSMNRLMKMLG